MRRGRWGLRSWRAGALGGALLLLASLPATAQSVPPGPPPTQQAGSGTERARPDPPARPVQRIGFSLTVSHASDRPGPVDPAVEELDQRLRSDFRYRSLRVIERRQLSLAPGEIGGLDLPSGKRVRIRPLHMGPGGVLLAVDIENTLHTDLRVPDRRPVVIGVDRYDDGKLILTLEPELPAR